MNDRNTYLVNVKCTSCGKTYPFQMHALIDTAQDPDAENKIFSGEYFETVCPYCHQVIPTSYPCMYHDGSKKLLIAYAELEDDYRYMKKSLKPSQSSTQLDEAISQWLNSCKVRIVRSEYELQEKVLIEHFDLDDRVIELARYEILLEIAKVRKGIRKLLFNIKDDDFVFILANETKMHEMVKMDQKMYDQVRNKYADVLKKPDVYEINEKWAKRQYKKGDCFK